MKTHYLAHYKFTIMKKIKLSADIGFEGKQHKIVLSLVEFKEDDVTIIYSPALDITGYGYSVEQAQESFEITLEEFVRYTHTNNTLEKALLELGWSVSDEKLEAPKNSDLVQRNPMYSDIVNSKEYKAFQEELEFAI